MPHTKHILVTGGAGFIGSHLVERLLAEGESVVVIDDCSTGRLQNLSMVASHPLLNIVPKKISQVGNLAEILDDTKSIYHLAAAVGVDVVVKSSLHVIDTNLRELEILLTAASGKGVPFIMTSTSEVYGRSEKSEFNEDDDLSIGRSHLSRWSYSCSKLMSEFLALGHARERGMPCVIARLFNTVGPRQTGAYGMVLPRFVAAALKGEPLRVFGDGRQTRTFCDVSDSVEALIRLQLCPAALGGVFNVGGTEEISILDLATMVIDILHSSSPIILVPYDDAYGPGFEDLRHGKPALEKLLTTTGFRPATSLRTVIERTAEQAVVAQ